MPENEFNLGRRFGVFGPVPDRLLPIEPRCGFAPPKTPGPINGRYAFAPFYSSALLQRQCNGQVPGLRLFLSPRLAVQGNYRKTRKATSTNG